MLLRIRPTIVQKPSELRDKDTVLILLAPPKLIKIFISEQWANFNLSNAIGALAILDMGGFPFGKSFTCLVNL